MKQNFDEDADSNFTAQRTSTVFVSEVLFTRI